MTPKNLALISLLALSTPALASEGAVVDGFGTDIPLSFAVDQIVPEKYEVSYGSGINVKKSVSWQGGRPWKQVLEETLSEEGLFVEYSNTDKIRITKDAQRRQKIFSGLKIAGFNKNGISHRKDSYADDLRGSKPGLVFSSEEQPVPEKDPGIEVLAHTPQPVLRPKNLGEDAILIGLDFDELSKPAEVWPVSNGSSLEDTLMSWGDSAGWKVVWKSQYSYPIMASAEFEGDFVSVAGKLIKVMSRAEPPIQGEFFKGNNVLVITNPAGSQF